MDKKARAKFDKMSEEEREYRRERRFILPHRVHANYDWITMPLHEFDRKCFESIKQRISTLAHAINTVTGDKDGAQFINEDGVYRIMDGLIADSLLEEYKEKQK